MGEQERELAVVTGASSGIGESFARQLAARGYRVLAVARRADRLEALAVATQGAVVPLAVDLTSPEGVAQVAARAEALGGASLVVSNAGFGVLGRFLEQPREVALRQIQLNVVAGVDLVHRLLPSMVARKKGGVIVVTSSGAFYPTPYLGVYGGTKSFLLSFAEALACELQGTGVRVMAACPGATSSEFARVAGMEAMMKSAPGVMTPDEVVTRLLVGWDAGRVVCLPGFMNWLMSVLFIRLPRAWTRALATAMFKGA